MLRSSLDYLHVLKGCPQGCTYDFFAYALKRSKSYVMKNLREIEGAGLIQIHSTRGRGQKAVVCLTPAGQQAVRELFP